MRAISPEEIKFIKKGLTKGFRLDGRDGNEMRPYAINTGEEILKTSNGACRLTLSNKFTILSGIKAGNNSYDSK